MVNTELSSVFGALSDPTRRDILQRLLQKEQSVNQLANAYAMSLPAVSKHISILETAGLITKEREGRQYIIRLSGGRFEIATEHLLEYQTALTKRLDSLDHYLQGSIPAQNLKALSTASPFEQTLTVSHLFEASPQR